MIDALFWYLHSFPFLPLIPLECKFQNKTCTQDLWHHKYLVLCTDVHKRFIWERLSVKELWHLLTEQQVHDVGRHDEAREVWGVRWGQGGLHRRHTWRCGKHQVVRTGSATVTGHMVRIRKPGPVWKWGPRVNLATPNRQFPGQILIGWMFWWPKYYQPGLATAFWASTTSPTQWAFDLWIPHFGHVQPPAPRKFSYLCKPVRQANRENYGKT